MTAVQRRYAHERRKVERELQQVGKEYDGEHQMIANLQKSLDSRRARLPAIEKRVKHLRVILQQYDELIEEAKQNG